MTAGERLVFGLAALPPNLAYTDGRLPHVVLPGVKLRLNTEALAAPPTPDQRLALLRTSLIERCDPWAPAQHRFVDSYLAFARSEARGGAAALQPFGGLFTAEDWLYSALRPLPRALLSGHDEGDLIKVDFAFWDGERVIAVDLRDRPEAERTRLEEWGVAWLNARTMPPLDTHPSFCRFWVGEVLPRSPFRRAAPAFASPKASVP